MILLLLNIYRDEFMYKFKDEIKNSSSLIVNYWYFSETFCLPKYINV